MSLTLVVLLIVVALVVLLAAYGFVSARVWEFTHKHYLRGLNDNEAVKRAHESERRAWAMRDAAWHSAFLWHREVIALNKAQRRLRRRLANNKRPQQRTELGGGVKPS